MVGFTLKNTLSENGSVARGVSQTDANHYLTSIVEMMKIERDGHGAKNTDADGKVTHLTGDEAVSMNFWGFTPALFPQIKVIFENFMKKSGTEQKSECYIPLTVGELVNTGQAKVKVLRSARLMVRRHLPRETAPPVVRKASANSSPKVSIPRLWE